MATVSDVGRELVPVLVSAGVVFPDDELALILKAASGLPATALTSNDVLGPRAVSEARRMVRRRAAGEPLPYVMGTVEFRTLELAIGPGAFIPRAMTGAVVDRAVAALPPDGVIVDIGTGCGAIAFAIAAERPDVQVLASDISDEALKWAAENRLRTGLEVGFFLGDLFEPFPVDVRGRVDVVVSNPPHVPAGAGSSLPRDVVDHEPGVALFAGPDGLSIINRIAAEATNWLRPGGWLVSELGDSQGEDVTRHLDSLGYSDIAVHLDDASRRRVIEAQWKEVGRRL